jgi:hypothetical protein
MIDWPTSLVEEVASRRCVLFIGAGASAGCIRPAPGGAVERPPNWTAMLNALLARATRASPGDSAIAREYIASGRLLEAAEIIKSRVPAADFSAFVTQTFRDYQHTDLHRYLNELDPKILVTTNFDKVYEQYCLRGEGSSGYVVHRYYDEGLVARLRSPQRLIVKVHGCMDTPERTVLTKSEFFGARQVHPGFFRVLESIFLTNTLLFIGYSMSDPDIQLLLENGTIAAQSAHPHYVVMPVGIHDALRQSLRKTYNVEVLEYDPANAHADLIESLGTLREAVLEFRSTHLDS